MPYLMYFHLFDAHVVAYYSVHYPQLLFRPNTMGVFVSR